MESVTQIEWKKFEKFCFPINKQALDFKSLKKIYKIFWTVYLVDNGISFEENKIHYNQLFADDKKTKGIFEKSNI